MGKKRHDYDISGMKLFGKCKIAGNCICGECANAQINQPVKVIQRNGDEAFVMPTPDKDGKLSPTDWNHFDNTKPEPRVEPEAPTESGIGTFTDAGGKTQPKCLACGKKWSKVHKCRNSPVKITRPGIPVIPSAEALDEAFIKAEGGGESMQEPLKPMQEVPKPIQDSPEVIHRPGGKVVVELAFCKITIEPSI